MGITLVYIHYPPPRVWLHNMPADPSLSLVSGTDWVCLGNRKRRHGRHGASCVDKENKPTPERIADVIFASWQNEKGQGQVANGVGVFVCARA